MMPGPLVDPTYLNVYQRYTRKMVLKELTMQLITLTPKNITD